MGDSKKFRLNECAVSDVLGEVLMTIIVVIMMTSIGMFVLSEPKISDVPHIDIYDQLDPFTDTIVIRNNGGESIPIRDLKLVLHSGSKEYVINGEELSSKLIEECEDNGYWDLSESISVNLLEVCSLDLENRDEDLDALLIHTPSKKVIYSSSISSIYLDDAIQSPNDRIPEDEISEEDIPEDEISEENISDDDEEGYIWIPPQLLAFDNSESPKGDKGSACLDDVQNIGGSFTTYYPDEATSMYEYFEFGLNESILNSFGVTFSDPYENLVIAGAKIKVRYEGHDGSFRWVKLQVWDQTDGTLYEYDLPEYKHTYGEKILDLPHITNTEDIENLNIYIIAEKNPGNSGNKYLHIDYLAVYIPSSGEESSAQNNPPVANAGGPYNIHVGQSLTFDGSNSNDPDGDPIEYLWDFGDGSTGSGVAPEHSYSASGTYSVTLTVIDNKSVTDIDVATVEVTEVPQENLIHIESVSVTTGTRIQGNTYVTGVAVVTIMDSSNNPVEGATVSGSWSGTTNSTDSSVTNEMGKITVYSDEIKYKNSLTFTFTVNGVTHPSYTWDNITKAGTKVYT
jgi:PKD repeat protein